MRKGVVSVKTKLKILGGFNNGEAAKKSAVQLRFVWVDRSLKTVLIICNDLLELECSYRKLFYLSLPRCL